VDRLGRAQYQQTEVVGERLVADPVPGLPVERPGT
jgi:hypothetical protein